MNRLAMQYALKYLLDKGDGSSQCCNAIDLLQAALYGPEKCPQVPLHNIVEHAKAELTHTGVKDTTCCQNE